MRARGKQREMAMQRLDLQSEIKKEQKARAGLEAEIGHLQQQFRLLDTDGDGYLSKDEFKLAMAKRNPPLNSEQDELAFAGFDTNKDGKIEFEEWLACLADKNNTGTLSRVATGLGSPSKQKSFGSQRITDADVQALAKRTTAGGGGGGGGKGKKDGVAAADVKVSVK